MPRLFCQNGDHWYDRESQRGRPPLHCDEHRPAKPTVRHSPANSTPKATPTSAIQDPALRAAIETAEAEARMETLHCAVGDHDFQWERKRGRRPQNCPEHSSAISRAISTSSLTQHQSELIRSILEHPRAASCRCGLSSESTPAEIRAKYAHSCTDPQFICPTLDNIGRTLNL
jgi:hypothetical protein